LGLTSLEESLLIRGKFSYAAGHHKYQKVQYLSAGSYGFVVLAVDKDNGDLVSFGGTSFAQHEPRGAFGHNFQNFCEVCHLSCCGVVLRACCTLTQVETVLQGDVSYLALVSIVVQRPGLKRGLCIVKPEVQIMF
jgi:hypothetical protein